MAFKPFKPPSSKKQQLPYTTDRLPQEEEPASKRVKLSHSAYVQPPDLVHTDVHLKSAASLKRPLQPLRNPPSPDMTRKDDFTDGTELYFSALWRKQTQKKNKIWDDDGYLSIKAGIAILYSNKGKVLGQTPFTKDGDFGVQFLMAGKEVEIGDQMNQHEFRRAVKLESVEILKSENIQLSGAKPRSLKDKMQSIITEQSKIAQGNGKEPNLQTVQRLPFKQPMKDSNILPQVPSEKPIPRHDPNAPSALVFKRPRRVLPGQQIVDVVLDPLLTKHLREHQREGVKFLYECVTNNRMLVGHGCILADDMGLGKTLQTIALIWTLIKQNPIYKAEPLVKKVLIVCPVSLIQNWKKEFRKWLGRDRLGVLTLEDKGSRLGMFDGKNFKVMIVGYEKLRTIAEDLTRGAAIDLVVCDEGHRLKTLKNKSVKAIETLNTQRRIILSGTPIQNDLSEFFAMANFVNDGCLGSYKSFVRDFETPIIKSRQPGATEDDIEKGELASEDLLQTTSPFILRRTADILSKYLPSKTEYVLFCKPTPEQARLYQEVVKSPMFHSALGSTESALQLITILKKLCNSPALMRPDRGNDESTSTNSLSALAGMLSPGSSRLYHNSFSSKIRLLDELLQQIRTTTDDKVILVSNYTSTLNLMASLLDSSGGKYLRLDGTVPQGKRQGLVDEFNKSPSSTYFAFLLSAKAGGVGLNLIGANRLVLFDVDWNPATDDQAMARIHREGQRKPCKIYRFLIKGGLEERIWQRQVVKRGLADSIMDAGSAKGNDSDLGSIGKKGKAAFSREELRDLFRLDESESLKTHDLIQCTCDCTGQSSHESTAALPTRDDGIGLVHDADAECTSRSQTPEISKEQQVEKHQLMQYSHVHTAPIPDLSEVDDEEKLTSIAAVLDDECLMSLLRQDKDTITGRIAYVFKKSTMHEEKSLE